MARQSFPFASFPPFPAGELLADRVENEARIRTSLLLLLLIVVPACGALLMTANLYFSERMYEARGSLEVVPKISPRFASARLSKTGLKNHAEMLTGTSFRQQVFRDLPQSFQMLLPTSKHILQKKRAMPFDPSAALAGLKVRAGSEDYLLTVSYRNKNPDLAAAVVSAALTAAETQPLQQGAERAERAAVFINSKLEMLDARIQGEQAELDKLQGVNGPDELTSSAIKPSVSALGSSRLSIRRSNKRRMNGYQSFQSTQTLRFKEDRNDPMLNELQRADNRAKLTQRLADARLNLMHSLQAAGDSLDLTENSHENSRKGTLGNLRTHLDLLQADYAALAQTLAPNNPLMVTASAQIDAIQKQLDAAQTNVLRQAAAADRIARASAAAVGTALAQRRALLQDQLRKQVGTAILELELSVDLSVYEDYLQLLESRPAENALQADALDVVERPAMPLKPMSKPYREEIRYGMMIGFLVGLGLVAVLYTLRASIWRIHQAEQATGMGIITILPHMQTSQPAKGARDPMAVLGDVYALGIDELRANLGILSNYLSAQVVVITSASPSQGKTTTAANLAVRLAQGGDQVLLIDADLHRPVMHMRLGLANRVGVSNILSGKADFNAALQHHPSVPGLDVLCAGPPPPLASQMLQSTVMEGLILEARNRYRYVLIDTAPVLAAGDAVFLSSKADLLFMLARFGQVELRLLRRAQAMLRHSDVPYGGLIINDVRQTWLSRLRVLLPKRARAI